MRKYVYLIPDDNGYCDNDVVIYDHEKAIAEALTGAEVIVMDADSFEMVGTIFGRCN